MTALSVVTLESCDLCIFNSCCPVRWSSKLKAIIESLFGLTNMYIIPFKNNASPKRKYLKTLSPSKTDGVHRNENFVEIIPVFSTFSKFFKVFQKKL